MSIFTFICYLGLLYFVGTALVKAVLSDRVSQMLVAVNGTEENAEAVPVTKPIKLYSHQEVVGLLVKLTLIYEDVFASIKILREENHTKFAVQATVACLLGAIVGSIFSGFFLLWFASMALLLLPGLYRRGVLRQAEIRLRPLLQKLFALIPNIKKKAD